MFEKLLSAYNYKLTTNFWKLIITCVFAATAISCATHV